MSTPTLVLDTNAWLDVLVFEDPRVVALAACIDAGHARIAIDDRAIDELARVLRYPPLAVDEDRAGRLLARAVALSRRVDVGARRLPRCRDPDDQMFLEIAVAADAAALLTRDAELLRMARRMAREHALAILPPFRWRDAMPPSPTVPAIVGRLDQMSKR